MDERGLWRLFFITGLPEAYLAIRGERDAKKALPDLPSKTAFSGGVRSPRQI
ncbi:hypothetical protein [Pseudoflavonifractor phocaeensis]|uniref:hypothetical protein n=1 Tax=Pseudoflavonifractor phocaeensis TaxID=1870988 RepID=UPI001F2CBF83|nr:hypothetical protein [Pseudoflavonifractor phocaeensis]MCF2660526.1 hypothetical protein [Pseudoflavonifractor phocaeensis]